MEVPVLLFNALSEKVNKTNFKPSIAYNAKHAQLFKEGSRNESLFNALTRAKLVYKFDSNAL